MKQRDRRALPAVVVGFDDAFAALTGHRPFPWQRRLFDDGFSRGQTPAAVDIPTGLGKTAVMAVWLLALAAGAALPRRLAYVVDRRAVVDQATEFAEQLRRALHEDERLEAVRRGLGLHVTSSDAAGPAERLRPLAISTLRGRHADNREWMADPAAPAIVVGTVDMVGSRLLFEGYGVSRRMRPYAAGLLGCDTLVMLDEAHLARPFERLLGAIMKGQRAPSAAAHDGGAGVFAGAAAGNGCPPPFRVLSLSATLGHDGDMEPFGLGYEDRDDATVRARLEARKRLTVEDLEAGSSLAEVLAERAWALLQGEAAAAPGPPSVVVYCDRRADAEKVERDLRKRTATEATDIATLLLVGGRRVHERQEDADRLQEHGLMGGDAAVRRVPVFLVATSAGEVGVDLDADHMVCDLVAWERMVQRLGRVNRRGAGRARVLVIDQGPPDGNRADDDAARHDAVRALLDALPRDAAGEREASPGLLAGMGRDPALRKKIAAATTRMPLYPALTRPLVDAWAMTSLIEHAGRPEVGPWLRGWTDDVPQTAVVWRRYLPVRFADGAGAAHAHTGPDVRAFFEAAPPHATELLETETARVADWLRKRARKHLKGLARTAEGPPDAAPDPAADDQDAGEATVERRVPPAPMSRGGPVAFLLDGANRPTDSLSLAAIDACGAKDLQHRLAGGRLVVDARFGGIDQGLLDDGADAWPSTMEDNWGEGDASPEKARWNLKVEALAQDLPAAERWQEVLALPYGVSPEGEALSRLTVQKRHGDGESEDARAVARAAQRLDQHQAWAAEEAERIADALGLGAQDKAMLAAAARHHDDGKSAERWQHAFNAPPDWRASGAYAKTSGPCNRHRLNGFRHELKSALDAESRGLDGLDRADPRFELALHLIAAHHGFARPAIGVGGYDGAPPSAAEASAHAIARRFARLQRQWGPWGLAWWEALLRAADQAASRRLEEAAG